MYLLTDGRPDQPAEQVLAHVQQQQLAGATLPAVHTISFNCGDSAANHFLSQLSSCTGGRYYYVCDDVADPQGPRTYEVGGREGRRREGGREGLLTGCMSRREGE